MNDKATQMLTSQPNEETTCPFFVLSLDEGFKAFRWYIENSGHGLSRNATFWQRCRQAIRNNRLGPWTALDVYHAARNVWVARRSADKWEAFLHQRMLHELRYGMQSAIGYLAPRTEDALPVLIPKEVWVNPDIDWDHATVSGAGFEFVYVRIVMHQNYPELWEVDVDPEPLPLLAPFKLSDQVREGWGVPASVSEKPRRKTKTTYRDQIISALEELGDDESRTDQQLAHEIQELVKKREGLTSNRNLGEDAILKHVRAHRKRQGKN